MTVLAIKTKLGEWGEGGGVEREEGGGKGEGWSKLSRAKLGIRAFQNT